MNAHLLHNDITAAILHDALDCIVIANQRGEIIEFNPAAERVFGYSRAQVLHRLMSETIIPPHMRAAHDRGMDHYHKTGEGPVLGQRIEVPAMRADGSLFTVELAIVPTTLGAEPVFLAFMRDITQAKQDHEKLLRTSARLSQLLANLDGGVLVEDESRHIVLVNEAFCEMFAINAPPAALVGQDCSNSAEQSKGLFLEPEQFVTRIAVILRDRQTVFEEMLHLRDGRVFARDYVPVYSDSDYIGHLWHYHDVTERVRTHQRGESLLKFEAINREIARLFLQLNDVDSALNQALALTGQVLDVSRVYVFRFRENERLLDNTHEWCAPGVKPEIDNLKGLPFDEILPSFFPMIAANDLIAPRHISELPEDLRGVLEPQDVQTILWMPFYVHQRIEGFVGYDETRHPREWLPEEITMAHSITESYGRALERESAERALVKARDDAVRVAQLRAQFVANMSHEIRTPMTGTLGMLELLLETGLDDLQREFANEAYRSSSRLLKIINDVLDFSKLEAGQIVLEAHPIDLKAIATEVMMTLSAQLKGKPLRLTAEIDPETPYRVFGDATRIRQVLMNLVGNAVKFTPQGEVVIVVKPVHWEGEIVYLAFEVRDTGIGIAPEHLQRIFESFVQADGSTTRKFGGSGLGLSISKQLVELMGGTLKVESTPNAGSTFNFTLRLPVAQVNSTQATQRTDFGGLNVLIVDPNRTVRYVLTQQLENWGVQVVQADDFDAWRAMQSGMQRSFDVVFQRYVPGMAAPTPDKQHMGRTIYLADQSVSPASSGGLCLQWPIDQSTLYNVLMDLTNPQPVALHPAVSPVQAQRGRVLLVDDYPINLELVSHALASLNVQLDSAGNGQEALERLNQQHYDVILMDMHMPVMDGSETTQQIRTSGASYRAVPIIAFTASVMPEERQHYLEIGVNEIVSKPFSLRYLRDVVQQWLEKRPQAQPMPIPSGS